MEIKNAMVALPLVILFASCGQGGGHGEREKWTKAKGPAPTYKYSERVHSLGEFPGVTTNNRGIDGKPQRIRCSTCHKLLPEARADGEASPPKKFHLGVKLAHGKDHNCRTCHAPPDFESFRLSGGKTLPYPRLMELCGQCHSGQLADFRKGIHGGMAGHWDLNRGPRDRNHCVDCHDPHRPAIPRVRPAPRPRYRFLDGK